MRWLYAASSIALFARLAAAQPQSEGDQAPPPAEAAPEPAPTPPAAAEPVAPPTAVTTPPTKPPDQSVNTADLVSLGNDRGFRFGSYGRVIAGTDLRGGKPEQILVVAHGPRIVEDSYLELDTSYGFETPRGAK